MSTVLILLAAYNGQKYIGEMIDSIISQDYTDWHLILSDDSSSDSTSEILEDYANKYPEKITHYKSGERFGNAQNHFMHLLKQFNDAPYIMFCDQDDVWHSDKISKTLAKMKEVETDVSVPTLVHTDLRVVDKNLNEISNSFCKSSNLDGNRLALNYILAQNVITGCTVMINRPLAELTNKSNMDNRILMHDWWCAIIASAFGNIGFLDEATIDYRQHGNNSVGAKNVHSIKYIFKKVFDGDITKTIRDTYYQAEYFLKCFENELSSTNKQIVLRYSKNAESSKLKRIITLISGKYWKNGLVRKLGQIFWG